MNPPAPLSPERVATTAEHLAQAVRFATVSATDVSTMDLAQHTAFQDWVLATYPLVAQHLKVRRDGPWHLRLFWKGRDAGAPPLILLAHYDVVPPGDPSLWKHGPFSGDLADGHVWGRGTLDVKVNLVVILEAVEHALATGLVPRCDVWLCFGGDEEIGGERGAGELGRQLAAEGVKDAWLVDEGGVIARDVLSFVRPPVALIGVAEKGYLNLRVTAQGWPGHPSMPPRHTAAGRLARALVAVESHPFRHRLTRTLEGFLKGAGRHVSPVLGFFLRSPRLWWPVLRRVLAADPKTAAMIATTQAITMLRASDKENVLPAEASAIVNLRLLPGDTVQTVVDRFRALLTPLGCEVDLADARQRNEALPESATEGPAWDAVVNALNSAEPSAVPLPYLVMAGTDTRHYRSVCAAMYRTQALLLGPEEIDLIHSPNERVSLENLGRSLRFYDALLRS